MPAEQLKVTQSPVFIRGDDNLDVTVTNLGPGVLYYGGPTVSASSNDGSVSVGASSAAPEGRWVVSASKSIVAVIRQTVEEAAAEGGGSLPDGGTDGQVLTKQSGTDGDADWEDATGGSSLATVTAGGNLGATETLTLAATEQWLTGTLDQDCTVTVAGLSTGRRGKLLLRQDATGGWTLTITDGSTSTLVTIPTEALAACQVDLSTDGTDLYIDVAGGGDDTIVTANLQTASYTLVLTDAGKAVELNHATNPLVLTIPPASSVAFPTGTVIELVRVGAGTVTITPGSGVTIPNAAEAAGTTSRTIANRYGSASIRKRGDDEWHLVGDIA
jgi:hypothetical protein